MLPRGLEPRTLRLLAVRSNQLSYETHVKNSEWGQDPMTPGPQDPRPQDPGHQDPRFQDPPPQDPRPQDPQPHVLKFFKFSLGGFLKLLYMSKETMSHELISKETMSHELVSAVWFLYGH